MNASDVRNNWIGNAIAIILVQLILCAGTAMAQKAKGLYLTAGDFINGQLSFQSTNNHRYKIKTALPFKRKIIRVIENNTVHNFAKDTVFGFQDSRKMNYRFFQNTAYTVIYADTAIVLYRLLVVPTTKYGQVHSTYFFSRTAAGPLRQLTLYHLEQAFSENKRFQLFIEIYFKNDEQLSEFDTLHNTYKVCRLLELSKNTNN